MFYAYIYGCLMFSGWCVDGMNGAVYGMAIAGLMCLHVAHKEMTK